MTESERFLQETSWNAFSAGFAGVIAAMLLAFFDVSGICRLGVPRPPQIVMSDTTVNDATDLRVSVTRFGMHIDGADCGCMTPDERLVCAVRAKRYERIVVIADARTKYGALDPVFRTARAHALPVVFANGTSSVLEQL